MRCHRLYAFWIKAFRRTNKLLETGTEEARTSEDVHLFGTYWILSSESGQPETVSLHKNTLHLQRLVVCSMSSVENLCKLQFEMKRAVVLLEQFADTTNLKTDFISRFSFSLFFFSFCYLIEQWSLRDNCPSILFRSFRPIFVPGKVASIQY